MKKRPILFSGPMVRAILSGQKTQTRRVVNKLTGFGRITEFQRDKTPGYDWIFRCARLLWNSITHRRALDACPYGQPGDRLWVRETCFAKELSDDEAIHYTGPGGVSDINERIPYGLDGVFYFADSEFIPIQNTQVASDAWAAMYAYRGSKGATVPAIHMPRWASRITLEIVSVRVERLNDISEKDAKAEGARKLQLDDLESPNYWRGFKSLWESINGAGSWDANPWVWVIEFKRID